MTPKVIISGPWLKNMDYGTTVFEYPARIPYLDVLVHLDAADGVFVVGSSEPHYTPSKVYQDVLSGKPVAEVLNRESTAVKVIRRSSAGLVLDFDGEKEIDRIRRSFVSFFRDYVTFQNNFDVSGVDMTEFNTYSAKNVTKQLAQFLDQVVTKKSNETH